MNEFFDKYDTSAFYYLSQKPCRDWQESYKEEDE